MSQRVNEGFYVFHEPGSAPKPIMKPQYLCLLIIFVGFASELFTILTEFRQMKRISGQYLDLAAEMNSIEYKNNCLVTQVISIILLYFSLFFGIYKLKYLWRHFHSNAQFSLFVFFYAEIVVFFPPNLHKNFYVENKFGYNKMSIALFLRDTFIKIVLHFVLYYLFLLPIFYLASRITIQAPKKRKTKLHITETKPVQDLFINDDLSDLTDVEIEGEDEIEEEGEQFFEQSGNLWIFVSMHLFFILLLCSYLVPKTEYLFNTIIPAKSTNQTQKYNALVSGLKGNVGLNLEFILPTRNTHVYWKISGYWYSKPLITENTLTLLQQSELKAIGRYLSRSILEGYNLKSLLFSCIPLLLFGLIFKYIMLIGVAPYGVQRGRPMAIVIFISLCFFKSVYLFVTLFIHYIQTRSIYNTDCDVAKEITLLQDPTGALSSSTLKDALIKVYRINNEAAEASTLYHLFYDDAPTLINRVNNIDLCKVTQKL